MAHPNRATTTRPTTPDHEPRKRGAEIGARVGYAAHGVVYGLVSVFAIDAAFGGGGESAKGGRAAISRIAQSGLGTALLGVLTFGLLAYALMRFWQGIADPGGRGHDAKGIGVRIGRIGSGLVQLLLALYAADLAFGWYGAIAAGGGGGQSGGASDLTARVMSWPAGRWIIGAVGVGIAAAALRQLQHAISADFMRELSVGARKRQWVEPTGRAGFASRFVVFGVIGVLLVVAAWQADPSEAEGLGGALRTLRDQAYGPWLLGIVAIGLLAFAVTRGIYVRYKIIPQQDRPARPSV